MTNEEILRQFMDTVWNEKSFSDIPKFIADSYTIYLDHTDPWEGKTLSQDEFAIRLHNTFDPFPDVYFDIKTAVSDGDTVGITWIMTGTNTGNIGNFPATNRKIEASGMTLYHFRDGKICGHTQVYDRTTIMKQLGFIQ